MELDDYSLCCEKVLRYRSILLRSKRNAANPTGEKNMIISALVLTPAALATPLSAIQYDVRPPTYDWQSQTMVLEGHENASKPMSTTFRGKQSFVNGSFVIDGYDSD